MLANFENVTVVPKANVYFDGKVISHTILLNDGTKKTIGTIYPGTFHFSTASPEEMEIISGVCAVKLNGETSWKQYSEGQLFKVPGNSGFDIEVKQKLCEYICSFMKS